MKLRVCAWAVGILVAAASASGVEGGKSGVRINLDEPAPGGAQPGKPGTVPAKPVPGKQGPDTKKEEARKVDGLEVSRGERGYLGIRVDGGFRISFYDREKKPVQADVARIALRWPVKYQPNDERTVLLPTSDGTAMASEKIVRPPHRFKLFVTLLKDTAPGEDPAPETYVVDFAQ